MIYIHPRSTNLSHVNAISDLFSEKVAISKEPWSFLRLLFRAHSPKTYVLAGNLDFIAISAMALLAPFPGTFVLLISSCRTNYLHRLLLRFYVKAKNARIAFVTEHARSKLGEHIGLNIQETSEVVFHSSRTADIALASNHLVSWEQRGIDVLFFGRLNEERGLKDFIRIAEKLPRLRFAVAGTGPLVDVVSEAAERLPNLSFLGFIRNSNEKFSVLSDTKVLFSGMRGTENFGISILEAVAAGAATSCPRDYGPEAILGKRSPYLRERDAGLDEVINHIQSIVASGPEAHDVQRFSSSAVRERWHSLVSQGREAVREEGRNP